MPGTPITFPSGAGESDRIYLDSNLGLLVTPNDNDRLWIDSNVGVNIPPQDSDRMQIDGNTYIPPPVFCQIY